MTTTPPSSSREFRIAAWLYRFRWWTTLAVLSLITGLFGVGVTRVGSVSEALGRLGDTTNGAAAAPPVVFDPSMDVWFGARDEAVAAYYNIEDRFLAEDYVMVTFEAPDEPLGVFSTTSLETIARLTKRLRQIPGVRHVRSLTANPWIRWGRIEEGEEGLLISDLIDGDPGALDERARLERLVAILGAKRAARMVGEKKVREFLGADAKLDDFIGEPRLIGTIVNEAGTATVIQVQVLRPQLDPARVDEALGTNETARNVAPLLYSVQRQRAALRGIEHFLRVERGLSVRAPGYAKLEQWIASLPEGEEQEQLRTELVDPTRTHMVDASGAIVRKVFEYDPDGDSYVDTSDPKALATAPAGFTPKPLSPYTFRVGGVPSFERNFEEVGMADARFIPLMFTVIAICLAFIFRHAAGVFLPLFVVLASILGMVGAAFTAGDLFNNLTMMTPNMLTAVGVADAIHLVAAWILLRSRFDNKRDLIVDVIRRNALPVMLTSITTAVGFYSLTVSGLRPVTMLGYTAGFGTLLAFLVSMTAVPALLSLLPHRQGPAKARRAVFFTPERSSLLVGRILKWRKPLLVLGVGLLVLAAWGAALIEIDSDFRRMFSDDNPTLSDFTWIESRMGGVGDLEIVFSAPAAAPTTAPNADDTARLAALRLQDAGSAEKAEGFAPLSAAERAELVRLAADEDAWNSGRIGVSVEFLAIADAFERRLRREMKDPASDLAVVSDLMSPLDILRKMHQVQNKDQAQFYRVPEESDVPAEARRKQFLFDEVSEDWSLTPAQSASTLVAQYYLQYESGAKPGENLATQLSATRRAFRMQGRVVQASSARHLKAFQRIEEIARTEFPQLSMSVSAPAKDAASKPSVAGATLSGKTLLFARTSQIFATGYLQSMAIALTAITLLIGMLFRSVRLALISLIPNVLPIVLPLGAFGLLGIPLDGPSIVVATVALGVCVDDTIHFFAKFVRAQRAGKSIEESLAYVFEHSGAAICITTVVLVIGFSTMLLSDFAPNFQMGALATLMIGFAWFADFALTTAALSFMNARQQKGVS